MSREGVPGLSYQPAEMWSRRERRVLESYQQPNTRNAVRSSNTLSISYWAPILCGLRLSLHICCLIFFKKLLSLSQVLVFVCVFGALLGKNCSHKFQWPVNVSAYHHRNDKTSLSKFRSERKKGKQGNKETKMEGVNPLLGFPLGKVSTLAHLILSSRVKSYGPNTATYGYSNALSLKVPWLR